MRDKVEQQISDWHKAHNQTHLQINYTNAVSGKWLVPALYFCY